ncbi:hypothetical protein Clacol_004863 [Clathrus columnatus]|uniref:Uncharacterized protein n=1 Tax=Clathrus columnatus TaxID=1419009 RepID=A0AAV5A7N4_9AGAM|nr:hypothetical protein Clacol_004863 [Clathrus columnatus]
MSDDQSLSVIEKEWFLNLLFLLQNSLDDKDIPHRMSITKLIHQSWNSEFNNLRQELTLLFITSDGAANMAIMVEDFSYLVLLCFQHNLHLTVSAMIVKCTSLQVLEDNTTSFEIRAHEDTHNSVALSSLILSKLGMSREDGVVIKPIMIFTSPDSIIDSGHKYYLTADDWDILHNIKTVLEASIISIVLHPAFRFKWLEDN